MTTGITHIKHELDVALEKSLFGAHADGGTKNFASGSQVQTTYFESGVQDPQFGKGEYLMWYQGNCCLVYLPSPGIVLRSYW